MSSDTVEEFPLRRWDVHASIVFRKTNESWGGFSNMCAGFPIVVNGQHWLTSEALYQAMRFPSYPEVQEEIRQQRSPMAAKMKSKPARARCSRHDWDEVREEAMWWCLCAKLTANEQRFGRLLSQSNCHDVVEHSHRDRFWGAVRVSDDHLEGRNVLGVLISRLRDKINTEGFAAISASRPPVNTVLLGASEFVVTPAEPAGPETLF